MKKYITTFSFAKIIVLIITLFSNVVSAQTDLPDAPDDTTPAPIDDYVWFLAFLGLVFVFFRFKSLVKQTKNSIKLS
jgi:hypothetical protein